MKMFMEFFKFIYRINKAMIMSVIDLSVQCELKSTRPSDAGLL